MKKTETRSEVLKVSELLLKGKFLLPWHQRKYDWDPIHVEELLLDLHDAFNDDQHSYFLGSILLVEKSKTEWEINDGQQRLTTYSLVCSWFRNFSDEVDDDKVNQVLFYNKANDQARIVPPLKNKVYYDTIIKIGGAGASNKLTNSYKVIDNFIRKRGLDNKKFVNYLLSKVEMSCIYIPAKVNPCSVFETINCRGRKLDDFDLIRNYFFSFFNEKSKEKEEIYTRFDKLETVLGSNNKCFEYINCYFQCKFGYLHQNYFYRELKVAIKKFANGKNSIYSLVTEFTEDNLLDLYLAMKRPTSDEFMTELSSHAPNNNSKSLITLIDEMNDYKIVHPLLFSILSHFRNKKNLTKEGIRSLYKKILLFNSFIMRSIYLSNNFSPALYYEDFSNIAKNLFSNKNISIVNLKSELKKCNAAKDIFDNNIFIEKMKQVSYSSTNKMKSLLFGINSVMSNSSSLIKYEDCNLEFVLPKSEKHWKQWNGFAKNEHDIFVNRIGNVILLGKYDKKPNGNQINEFNIKQKMYLQSSLSINRNTPTFKSWSPKSVDEKQLFLISNMVKAWPIQ